MPRALTFLRLKLLKTVLGTSVLPVVREERRLTRSTTPCNRYTSLSLDECVCLCLDRMNPGQLAYPMAPLVLSIFHQYPGNYLCGSASPLIPEQWLLKDTARGPLSTMVLLFFFDILLLFLLLILNFYYVIFYYQYLKIFYFVNIEKYNGFQIKKKKIRSLIIDRQEK